MNVWRKNRISHLRGACFDPFDTSLVVLAGVPKPLIVMRKTGTFEFIRKEFNIPKFKDFKVYQKTFVIIGIWAIVFNSYDIYNIIFDAHISPTISQSSMNSLKISGEKESNMTIEISVRYQTNKPWCEKASTNPLVGSSHPRSYFLKVTTQQSLNKYEASVPIENIVPGMCDWTVKGIHYNIIDKYGKPNSNLEYPSTLIWFSEDGADRIPNVDIKCQYQSFYGTPEKLFCRQPLGSYFLNKNSNSLRVNFREKEWMGLPPDKLGS